MVQGDISSPPDPKLHAKLHGHATRPYRRTHPQSVREATEERPRLVASDRLYHAHTTVANASEAVGSEQTLATAALRSEPPRKLDSQAEDRAFLHTARRLHRGHGQQR